MNTLDLIIKTREYLNYLEEHILNVHKAWRELKFKCKDLISCDILSEIDAHMESHDLSKLGAYEFTQYRKRFFPTADERPDTEEITAAMHHHYKFNLGKGESVAVDPITGKIQHLDASGNVVDECLPYPPTHAVETLCDPCLDSSYPPHFVKQQADEPDGSGA